MNRKYRRAQSVMEMLISVVHFTRDADFYV